MTWTRLSDTLNSDLRFMRLSDGAFRLHVKALVWCNQMLTDGLLPADALGALTYGQPHAESLVAELVREKLWTDTAAEGAPALWQLDWTDQEPAEDVERRKGLNADRQRRFRQRRDAHAAGDHSLCDPQKCRARKQAPPNALRNAGQENNALGNALRNAVPSRPVPTPTGSGSGGGGAADAEPPATTPEAQPVTAGEPVTDLEQLAAQAAQVRAQIQRRDRAAARRQRPSTDPMPVGAVLPMPEETQNGRAFGAADEKRKPDPQEADNPNDLDPFTDADANPDSVTMAEYLAGLGVTV